MSNIVSHYGNANWNHIRYNNKPTRMAKIKNNNNTKGWWGSRGTVSLIHCWWECKIKVTLGKKYGNFLQNHVYTYQYPTDVFLGICCRELKTYVHTKTSTWLSITALFTVDPNWKQASVLQWLNVKQTLAHPYHGILFSNKKREELLTPATTSWDVKGIMMNEKSQP